MRLSSPWTSLRVGDAVGAAVVLCHVVLSSVRGQRLLLNRAASNEAPP